MDILNEYDSKLFDTLSMSSNKTFFFASNMKENTARWSKGAVEYFGLEGEILCPADALWASRIHPDDMELYVEDFKRMENHISAFHDCEYRIRNAEGEYVWVNCKGHMTYDEDGNMDFFAGFVTNMGSRNKVDPTTELWTVYEFRNDIEDALEKNEQGSILLIGINNFKRVNDEYSYSFGDKVLHSIARRLLELCPTEAKVYRMDGADFAIVLPNGNRDTICQMKEQIEDALAVFVVEGIELHLDFRSGATLYPQDGKYIDQIQNNLFYALDNAKFTKNNHVVFYDEEMHLKKTRTIRLKDALSHSVRHGFKGFRVVFQPIIDAKTGECRSAEALLRWSHEDFPGIGPMEFIPLLEETGKIVEVGKWVMEESVKQLATWRQKCSNTIFSKIHVNVSYIQFREDLLKEYVVDILDRYHMPHDCLILELTESCRVEHTEQLGEKLQRFKAAGMQIALDDFGTGYSSLSVLRDIPADVVKLDHTMTRTIVDRPKDRSLIEFIIAYCKKASVRICVEGVENEEILEIVRNAGAEMIQGYYYDKPLELDEFYEKYVKDTHVA